FSSRRRHTRFSRDWSSDVCSSDLTHTIERIETMGPTETERDDFRRGYVTAILWANAYREDEETGELVLDEDADYAYVTPGRWWEDVGIDLSDADDFLADNIETLRRVATVHAARWSAFESHGNDFALTRNGHGVGFWDHGYGEDGDVLSDVARAYGEYSVLTDDGPTVTEL